MQMPTFKPILFGEAVRLRCLNRSKEDYLTSLNRRNQKDNFPLENDEWHNCNRIKLGSKTGPPKCEKKMTQRFGLNIAPHLQLLIRKQLKYEGNDCLQKTHYTWTKTN